MAEIKGKGFGLGDGGFIFIAEREAIAQTLVRILEAQGEAHDPPEYFEESSPEYSFNPWKGEYPADYPLKQSQARKRRKRSNFGEAPTMWYPGQCVDQWQNGSNASHHENGTGSEYEPPADNRGEEGNGTEILPVARTSHFSDTEITTRLPPAPAGSYDIVLFVPQQGFSAAR